MVKQASAPTQTRVYGGRDVIALPDEVIEEVYVAEWQRWFRVRAISAGERERLLSSCMVGKGKQMRFEAKLLRLKIVALACVDAAGMRVFEAGDHVALASKNARAVDTVADVALKLAGIDDDEGDDEGDDEDFAGAQSGSSPTA